MTSSSSLLLLLLLAASAAAFQLLPDEAAPRRARFSANSPSESAVSRCLLVSPGVSRCLPVSNILWRNM